ncbi:hypothetical protein [Patulibacter sp. SYSU D01012]|uniref:hypothetical protein n=1 Tax=Patulibacter sp. SYSU D01012 TaxID=2817381 RepID=UPI001B31499F|nr:hypothetical protein [Patulibacter sp. SYSU D01012]
MVVPVILIVVGLLLLADGLGFAGWSRRVRWGRTGGRHEQPQVAPKVVGGALVVMGLIALVL